MPHELLKANLNEKTYFDVVNDRGDAISVSDLPPGARKIVFSKDEVTKAREESREKVIQNTGKEEELPEVKELLEGKELLVTKEGILEEKAKEEEKKQEVLLEKKVELLSTIESVREDLNKMDSYPGELNIEQTHAIAQEKLKAQEALTGMKQQTAELQSTGRDLEAHTPVHTDFIETNKVLDEAISSSTENVERQLPHTNEEESASEASSVASEVVLGSKKIETKEAVPFDIKKIYNALDRMLGVFSKRPDIMPSHSLNALQDVYNFMTEKIVGENKDKEVNLDLLNPDEINKEMVEKFEVAMDSLEVASTDEWGRSSSQEIYTKTMNDFSNAMRDVSKELGPLIEELRKDGPYNTAAGPLEKGREKASKFVRFFSNMSDTFI